MARRPTKKKAATPPAPDEMGREDYLVESLRQLEAMSRRGGSAGARVQAKTKAIHVRDALDQLREAERQAAAMPAGPDEHRAEILAEVRRLRQGSASSGSWVAAKDLLRAEWDMIVQAEAQAQARDAGRLAEASENDLRAEADALRAGLDAEPGGLRVVK